MGAASEGSLAGEEGHRHGKRYSIWVRSVGDERLHGQEAIVGAHAAGSTELAEEEEPVHIGEAPRPAFADLDARHERGQVCGLARAEATNEQRAVGLARRRWVVHRLVCHDARVGLGFAASRDTHPVRFGEVMVGSLGRICDDPGVPVRAGTCGGPTLSSSQGGEMAQFDDDAGPSAKRDRGARLMRVANLLRAHPDGIRVEDIAGRIGISRRTAYRDLVALEGELAMPTWSEGGRWGILDAAFLPPLKLTTSEAMAVFLAARLMVRYADKYDPDLASAFEKLSEGLPGPLTEHVARSLDVLQRAAKVPRFTDLVHTLTRAWAERRVVEILYQPAAYEGRRSGTGRRIVRPYLIEPSAQTHALYLIGLDEERGGLRTFKIERIREVTVTPRTFEPPEAGSIEAMLQQAWDIIADQPATRIVVSFTRRVARRVAETIWHRSQEVETQIDGSLTWRATVSGTIEVRLWILSWGDDAEVLEPAELRDDIRATLRRSLERYEPARGGA